MFNFDVNTNVKCWFDGDLIWFADNSGEYLINPHFGTFTDSDGCVWVDVECFYTCEEQSFRPQDLPKEVQNALKISWKKYA